jgi:hypothetical protein
VLEAAFILLESPSPSRRIFIGSHSLPPSLVRRIGPSGVSLESDENTCLEDPPRGTPVDPQRLGQCVVNRGVVVPKLLP